MAALIAAIEPTLSRSPALASRQVAEARTPLPPATQLHASSYFHALRDAGPVSASATAPHTPHTSQAAIGLAPTIGVTVAAPSPRRGLYLWLGGAVIAALIGLAIGLTIRRSASRSTSISTDMIDPPPSVAIAAPAASPVTRPAGDPGPADAPPGDAEPGDAIAAPPADARPAPVPGDASTAPVHVSAPVRNPAAEEHLRNAEEAFARQAPAETAGRG